MLTVIAILLLDGNGEDGEPVAVAGVELDAGDAADDPDEAPVLGTQERGKHLGDAADDPDKAPVLSPQELGERFGDAVWRVDVDGCGLTGSGTAFAIDANLFVTNAHVVEVDPSPQLTSRHDETMAGEVIGIRDWPDLALIRVDAPVETTLEWAVTEDLVEGQPLTALSYPTPLLRFSVAPGTLLSFKEEAGQRVALASDEITDFGSSGGPLLDARGRVAGVITEFADGDGRQLVGLSYTHAFLQQALEDMVANPTSVTADCARVGAPDLPEEWAGLDDGLGDADEYGDDPDLDLFWDACELGEMVSCDDLFRYSPLGTEYERFGDTCGDRQPTGTGVWCVDLETGGEASGSDAGGYGSDSALDALWDACAEGDWDSCDQLYLESPLDSAYERFGDTCGDRNEPAGWCTDVHG